MQDPPMGEEAAQVRLSVGKGLGKPRRPTPPGKAPNWDAETAKEANRKGQEVRALNRLAGKKQGQLTRAEWEALAHKPAFQGDWLRAFQRCLRSLRRQYAPPGSTETAQYAILIERLAACYTLAWRMQVDKADIDLVLKVDAQIKDYVSQLQRYTESEKKELTIRDDVQQQFLATTVVLAEATIADLSQREGFLIALLRQFVGEAAAEAIRKPREAKALPSVIEHEAK